jgi:hypothetical protein
MGFVSHVLPSYYGGQRRALGVFPVAVRKDRYQYPTRHALESRRVELPDRFAIQNETGWHFLFHAAPPYEMLKRVRLYHLKSAFVEAGGRQGHALYL